MQVPAYVEYEKATSVEHALALLARYGPEARILAGGHSLIPMMKLRLAQPETLIDINGLTELSYIDVADGELRIGALTRHAELLDSAPAGEHFAILHDAEQVIADPVVRNWGTIGGSLCQADPSEDLSAAFAALKASMVIRGPDGSQDRAGQGVPHRAVRDRGGARRDADRDQDPDPARRRQRLREGGPPGRATGRSARPGRRSGWTAAGTRSPRPGIGLTAVGAPQFAAAEAEEFLRGAPATEESFAGLAGSRPSTAARSRTSAARPTTNGTSPASSPCAALRRAVRRAAPRAASERLTCRSR